MLKNCKDFYSEELERYFGAPVGCSLAVIEELEMALNCQLPAAYRGYLLWMGADYNGAFRGSDWFARDILENTEYVPQLLAENNFSGQKLKPIVAFFCHQGYICAWFERESQNVDPNCWYFQEGDTNHPKQVGVFSEFLLQQLKYIAGVRSSLFK